MARIFRVVGQGACPPSPKLPEGHRVGVPADSNVSLMSGDPNSGFFGTRIAFLRWLLIRYDNLRGRPRSGFRDGSSPA